MPVAVVAYLLSPVAGFNIVDIGIHIEAPAGIGLAVVGRLILEIDVVVEEGLALPAMRYLDVAVGAVPALLVDVVLMQVLAILAAFAEAGCGPVVHVTGSTAIDLCLMALETEGVGIAFACVESPGCFQDGPDG